MTAKEYLEQAKNLDRQIDIKLERVSQLRSLAQRVTSNMGSEPVAHTRNVSSMEDVIIRVMEQEEALNAEIDRFVDLKMEIDAMLKELPDQVCRMVLEKRYLCYSEWNEIAAFLGVTVRSVYRFHSLGLQELEQILKKKCRI